MSVYPLPRWLTWTLLAATVTGAWLCAALFARNSGLHPSLAGVGFGSLCAVGTMAAIWTALGPLAIVIRVPVAVAIQLAVALTVAALEGDRILSLEVLGVFGGFLFGQYLLAQIPLWFVAAYWQVRIDSGGGLESPEQQVREQFRIRHMMLFTAAVAVFLGITRGVVQAWDLHASWPDLEIIVIIGFIVLCNTTMFLPLALAVLLPQRWFVATAMSGVFLALLTAVEVPTFLMIGNRSTTDEVSIVIVFMNLIQTLWVLLAMAILRLGGYRLRNWTKGSFASSSALS